MSKLPWLSLRVSERLHPGPGEDRQGVEVVWNGKAIGLIPATRWEYQAEAHCPGRMIVEMIVERGSVSSHQL